MDQHTPEQYQQCISELASFCFRKLASLEARFIILCHRAEQAGIPCSDLHPPLVEEQAPETMSPQQVIN